jgi:hypothetical protein
MVLADVRSDLALQGRLGLGFNEKVWQLVAALCGALGLVEEERQLLVEIQQQQS